MELAVPCHVRRATEIQPGQLARLEVGPLWIIAARSDDPRPQVRSFAVLASEVDGYSWKFKDAFEFGARDVALVYGTDYVLEADFQPTPRNYAERPGDMLLIGDAPHLLVLKSQGPYAGMRVFGFNLATAEIVDIGEGEPTAVAGSWRIWANRQEMARPGAKPLVRNDGSEARPSQG